MASTPSPTYFHVAAGKNSTPPSPAASSEIAAAGEEPLTAGDQLPHAALEVIGGEKAAAAAAPPAAAASSDAKSPGEAAGTTAAATLPAAPAEDSGIAAGANKEVAEDRQVNKSPGEAGGMAAPAGGQLMHAVLDIERDDGLAPATPQPPPAAAPLGAGAVVPPAGATGGGTTDHIQVEEIKQGFKRKALFICKVLGILGMANGLTAALAVTAALCVPLSVKSLMNVYLMYFAGILAPWLAGVTVRYCGHRTVKQLLPYICFAANNISSFFFSTGVLDYVVLRATVLAALLPISLVPYCYWASRRKVNLSFWRVALIGLTVLVFVYYADEVLSPALLGQRGGSSGGEGVLCEGHCQRGISDIRLDQHWRIWRWRVGNRWKSLYRLFN